MAFRVSITKTRIIEKKCCLLLNSNGKLSSIINFHLALYNLRLLFDFLPQI
jgi:hypothetical protein